jgi:hypothetical protein
VSVLNLEPKFPTEYPGGYYIDYDPSTKISLEKEIRYDVEMQIALETNATELVKYYLRRNMQRISFAVVQTAGRSESGKSYLSLALAFWLQDYIYRTHGVWPRIYLAWYWSDVLRLMKHTKPFDIVICDEESSMTGQESHTDKKRMLANV